MYKQLMKLTKPRLPAGALTKTFVIYIMLHALTQKGIFKLASSLINQEYNLI